MEESFGEKAIQKIIMLTELDKQDLAKYDLVNDHRTISLTNKFIEDLFSLITYFEWDQKSQPNKPDVSTGLNYGRIQKTEGKYYSLAQILTLENDDLKRFKQSVLIALNDIDCTQNMIKPENRQNSKRTTRISTDAFATTMSLLSKPQFRKGKPTNEALELLFEIMLSEKIEIDNQFEGTDLNQASLIINCNTGLANSKRRNSLIEIESIHYLPKAEKSTIDQMNAKEYFNQHVTKREIEDFLDMLETESLKLYSHHCLFHIKQNDILKNKKRVVEQDNSPLKPIHYKGTTAYIFPIL